MIISGKLSLKRTTHWIRRPRNTGQRVCVGGLLNKAADTNLPDFIAAGLTDLVWSALKITKNTGPSISFALTACFCRTMILLIFAAFLQSKMSHTIIQHISKFKCAWQNLWCKIDWWFKFKHLLFPCNRCFTDTNNKEGHRNE